MGVDITEIITAHEIKFGDLKNKSVAIDAHNSLYQFLAIIRQPDGTPLMDSHGRITSHLSGLLYRTANLVEEGIKPVYVFDGKPLPLKIKTIEARIEIRTRAEEEWKKALAEGDLERARMKAQQALRLTDVMIAEAKRLLEYMGVPYVQAPDGCEGEAQASYMARKGDVWASASQDYDSLLFGSPNLVRNLTITGRRKLPRKNVYVEVKPERISLEENLKNLGITREQLIDIGILVGTDFNDGVKGIGPKKALKLIRDKGSLENIMKDMGIEIEHYEEIREIFLNPPTTDDYRLRWGGMDEEKVLSMLCDEYEFSESRVKGALEKMKKIEEISSQASLDRWF